MSEKRLTTKQAAEHCGFTAASHTQPLKAFRKLVDYYGIKKAHCGRSLRFTERDLNIFMEGKRP